MKTGFCNPLKAWIGFPLHHLAGYQRSKKVSEREENKILYTEKRKWQDFALKRLDTEYDLTQGI